MNPFLATDGYKTGHHLMYPINTSLVYSNFTPRSNRHAPKGMDKVVSFGQQMVMRQIKDMFDEHFFKFKDWKWTKNTPDFEKAKTEVKKQVCDEIKKEYSLYLGTDYDISHIERLWDLGYLPIIVKSIPEGTRVPIGVPVLTIYNTNPDFYWLTNFLETLISNLLWKPITSATIAHQYKSNLTKWAKKTDKDNLDFVEFQGHDFSMRGLSGVDSVIQSGLGHATSFLGSDSLPVIYGARKYYNEDDFVIGSVNATEHSVMCAGGDEDELSTFRYLMNQFKTGILSIVSDTWDLWKVLTEYLPILKDEILARDGKIVIRPDSGDPVDIICGSEMSIFVDKPHRIDVTKEYPWNVTDRGNGFPSEYVRQDDKLYKVVSTGTPTYVKFEKVELNPEQKGVIELLWDIFGGTINEQGYKVLDSHIGAIYGDSITLARAEEICKRLEAKGFASTNVVLGIGSFTYQYNTRDTFGMAMKATYVEIDEEFWPSPESLSVGNRTIGREIFKDPITDDGSKKSAKGLLMVQQNDTTGELELVDQVDWKSEATGEFQTIFEDGNFQNTVTLSEIRRKLSNTI